jgi:spore germination protein GerM
MILKIVEVKKKYDDFTMDNGGKIFSIGASVEVDGQLILAKVRCFSTKQGQPTSTLEVGQVFETGKNCENIKADSETYKDKTYNRYTLYAKKQDKPGYAPRQSVTFTTYREKVELSKKLGVEMAGPDAPKELVWSYFSTILKGMENVSIEGKPVEEKVKEVVKGTDVTIEKDPFDDESIPF